ncbi:MAG: hypothetical protein NPIRA06_17900 [Nitrospirales bacterium]|nr:MAG: hypothetical protein NPIRA06_17900 [Nitrospirales bacterium]
MEKPESGHALLRKQVPGFVGSMAGEDETFASPGNIGDRGALKPGNDVMSSADNIRTVNGEPFNGPTQDMAVQMVEDDFDFRELGHRRLRGETK